MADSASDTDSSDDLMISLDDDVDSDNIALELNSDGLGSSGAVSAHASVSNVSVLPLYVSHFLSAWGDRCWEFGSALLFVFIFQRQQTLLPTALYAFMSQLFAVVFSPHIGAWIDRMPRLHVVSRSLIVQNACVCVAGLLQLSMFSLPGASMYGGNSGNSTANGGNQCSSNALQGGGESPADKGEERGDPGLPWGEWRFIVAFLLMNVCGGIARLASIGSDVSVTKDWVPTIVSAEVATAARQAGQSGKNDSEGLAVQGVTDGLGESSSIAPKLAAIRKKRLSAVNATMRRIDLSCKVLAPMFVSGVIAITSPFATSILLSSWNLVSLFPEYTLLRYVYGKNERALAHKQVVERPPQTFLMTITNGWTTYSRQVITLASLAYVMLYVTALNPGALLNGFLAIKCVPIVAVGAFQGVGAVFGLASTFIAPALIAKYSLAKVGLGAIFGQTSVLGLATICFFASFALGGDVLSSPSTAIAVYSFLVLVVCSRVFLWTFDLAEVQILQENIPESERGTVNSVEKSLTNLGTMASLALGMVWSHADDFQWVVLSSIVMLVASSITYTVFFVKKRHELAEG